MAKERRILRLQQLILEIAAEAIQRDVRDPRIGVVSITRVKLSSDLSRARIYWSSLGEDASRRTTERGLRDALPLIQRAVAHGLHTRTTPRLALQFDDTLERTMRLDSIFHEIHQESRKRDVESDEPESPDDETPDAETPDAETPEDKSAGSPAPDTAPSPIEGRDDTPAG